MSLLVLATPVLPARWIPHALASCVAVGACLGAVWPGYVRTAVVVAVACAPGIATTRVALAVLTTGLMVGLAAYALASSRMEVTGPEPVPTQGAVHGATLVVERAPAPSAAGWRYTASVVNAEPPMRSGVPLLVRQRRGVPPQVGDLVRVDGRLAAAAGPDAPAWWKRHLQRQAIAASLRTRSVEVVGIRGGIRGLRDRAARALRASIDTVVAGDDAAVVSGITLGFDERLSKGRVEAFRSAGMSHLLAVSGQNVALIGVVVLAALRRSGATRGVALVIAAAGVVAYAALCQPGASVMRATMVGLLALGACASGRVRRSGYPLIVTFSAMVAWSPRSLWDPGLILSFSAVIGILLLSGPIARRLRPTLPQGLALAVAVTAAATLATAPATLGLFGQLSLVGLATNLVAVPLAAVVLVAGLIGAGLGAVAPPLGLLPLAVAAGGAHLLIVMADGAAALPGATASPGSVALLAMAAGVAWAMHRVRSRRAA